ncbi:MULTISPECIES: hypothetical protein [Halobacterium]|uniref:hypothetical protein n=1 Tax=Halobacterium TaxID=2239 RepID=UPI00073E1846|nr:MULTISPECIES: hypothetical protein [Halobacterium]MCG1002669.1 hypothetical protein [Halobacterium noricense]
MAVATVARYTGSALSVVLAIGLLALAALHGAAGVQLAAIPAVGGVVLLGGALALAPETNRDLVAFLGAVGVAVCSVLGFVAAGSIL